MICHESSRGQKIHRRNQTQSKQGTRCSEKKIQGRQTEGNGQESSQRRISPPKRDKVKINKARKRKSTNKSKNRRIKQKTWAHVNLEGQHILGLVAPADALGAGRHVQGSFADVGPVADHPRLSDDVLVGVAPLLEKREPVHPRRPNGSPRVR